MTRDPGQVGGGARAERGEAGLSPSTTPSSSTCTPMRSEANGPRALSATDERHPGSASSPGTSRGKPRGQLLDRHPTGQAREPDQPEVARSRRRPARGARHADGRPSPGSVAVRRLGSDHGRPTRRAARSTLRPRGRWAGRRQHLGEHRIERAPQLDVVGARTPSRRPGAAGVPTDRGLQRVAGELEEGRALALPVVGQHDEAVVAARRRRPSRECPAPGRLPPARRAIPRRATPAWWAISS